MLFALTCLYRDYKGEAAGYAAVLIPLGLFGVYGILKAFRGNRRMAMRGGLCAGIPAALYYALVCADMRDNSTTRSLDGFAWLFCSGIFPAATAFWAILLAYLIPEKPPSDDP